ncbi:MAG TPA: hypothetical protein VNQ76_02895 [Planctomicrobium sp.]|nr:hypothetical protein [Planctomicrobium sp.]
MPSSFLKSVPSPEQIVERAAEIRAGWTVQQRARNRADLIKAGATDRIEGFRWPDETPESTEIENWDDEDEFEEIP